MSTKVAATEVLTTIATTKAASSPIATLELSTPLKGSSRDPLSTPRVGQELRRALQQRRDKQEAIPEVARSDVGEEVEIERPAALDTLKVATLDLQKMSKPDTLGNHAPQAHSPTYPGFLLVRS